MGIFHFFGWFKNNFSGSIKKLSNTQNLSDIDVNIDNLMIDMNGLFHNSAQKVYEYGNFKPKMGLFVKDKITNTIKQQQKVYEDVCKSIEDLLILVKPNKRLILCVDGPAPFSKIVQQRRRRFRSTMEREEDDISFDSNNITPGTKFMDHLSKYIDWYIRKRISEDPMWQNIEIILSNEKVPGEGEAKCTSYVRQYGSPEESYCIQGADADLIMLSLGTQLDKFYILREDTYDKDNKYFVIDIENTSLQLSEIMRWESEKFEYDCKNAIDDFIFLCFLIGNDFLPHIPSLEIIESGIDIIISIYKDVGKDYGHILKYKNGDIYFNKDVLKVFFEHVSDYERPILEKKLRNKRFYFQDEILESCAVFEPNKITLDIKRYRTDYVNKYFKDMDMEKVCQSYLEGVHWVITYYKKGVPDWKWYYPYDYAPPAIEIIKYISKFVFPKYNRHTYALLPFQQLLCVLPPKSAKLLPTPLDKLIKDHDSPLKEFYPDEFEVDLAGKKNDWQGIVILPIISPETILKEYENCSDKLNDFDKRRNIFGKSFIYSFDKDKSITFNSYYGNILNCRVKNRFINL